jgi:hypothetical protein
MRNGDKKPARRVDLQEPLERLSLLHLKRPAKGAPHSKKNAASYMSGRTRRWM